jgi:hypothetical protein
MDALLYHFRYVKRRKDGYDRHHYGGEGENQLGFQA